jgi:hypothetical protein
VTLPLYIDQDEQLSKKEVIHIISSTSSDNKYFKQTVIMEATSHVQMIVIRIVQEHQTSNRNGSGSGWWSRTRTLRRFHLYEKKKQLARKNKCKPSKFVHTIESSSRASITARFIFEVTKRQKWVKYQERKFIQMSRSTTKGGCFFCLITPFETSMLKLAISGV